MARMEGFRGGGVGGGGQKLRERGVAGCYRQRKSRGEDKQLMPYST